MWATARPGDAAAVRRIADQPQALWVGEWLADPQSTVRGRVSEATVDDSVAVLVVYAIPHRDCGQYSAGGVASPRAYLDFVNAVANGIGSAPAVVIVEPDALAMLGCLPDGAAREQRVALLRSAVVRLTALAGVHVYLDAGHAGWIEPAAMAQRLLAAGVSVGDGFSLNVSSFGWTSDQIAYAQAVSQLTGGAHAVIDTSRNGSGPAPDRSWCNPPGRTLGHTPTAETGVDGIDAFLWLKTPGLSDGNCNGGPGAGTWWPEYALDLSRTS